MALSSPKEPSLEYIVITLQPGGKTGSTPGYTYEPHAEAVWLAEAFDAVPFEALPTALETCCMLGTPFIGFATTPEAPFDSAATSARETAELSTGAHDGEALLRAIPGYV